MRLKRVVLITLAAIRALLMIITIGYLVQLARLTPEHEFSYYSQIISYVGSIAGSIRAICLLAVVDFVFCLGRRNYDKNMFAIAITMFAFAIILMFEGVATVAFRIPSFIHVILVDQYTGMAYFYLWTVLTTAPFSGLTIAYIVVKAKYLKNSNNIVKV